MPITDILERNCRLYGDDICLVEINPEVRDPRRVTWKEYELIEPAPRPYYRREITWNVFNEKANRFANLLLSRGVGKGDKVAILLMNCLEWLPIYFGNKLGTDLCDTQEKVKRYDRKTRILRQPV